MQRQLRIAGSFIYEHPQDMAAAVSLLAEVRAERILAPGTALTELPVLLAGEGAGRDGQRVAGDGQRGVTEGQGVAGDGIAPAAPGSPTGSAGLAGIKQWVDLRR